MRDYDAFAKGGYEVRYHAYGGRYFWYDVWIDYATKAHALRGIKNFKNGRWLKITEYPGKCKPGKEITLADLEEPEKE